MKWFLLLIILVLHRVSIDSMPNQWLFWATLIPAAIATVFMFEAARKS